MSSLLLNPPKEVITSVPEVLGASGIAVPCVLAADQVNKLVYDWLMKKGTVPMERASIYSGLAGVAGSAGTAAVSYLALSKLAKGITAEKVNFGVMVGGAVTTVLKLLNVFLEAMGKKAIAQSNTQNPQISYQPVNVNTYGDISLPSQSLDQTPIVSEGWDTSITDSNGVRGYISPRDIARLRRNQLRGYMPVFNDRHRQVVNY